MDPNVHITSDSLRHRQTRDGREHDYKQASCDDGQLVPLAEKAYDSEAAEPEMNDTDTRLWHPWLRIDRVLRVMLHTPWRAEAPADPPQPSASGSAQRDTTLQLNNTVSRIA
jgi:hypothetical protein